MAENLGLAIGVLQLAEHVEDKLVLIAGGGPIGLAIARLLVDAKARVIVLDRSHSRRMAAIAVGATGMNRLDHPDVLNSHFARDRTMGADLSIDAVGTDESRALCLAVLRTGGRFITVGIRQPSGPISWATIVSRRIVLHGAVVMESDFRSALTHPRLFALSDAATTVSLDALPATFESLIHPSADKPAKVIVEP